MPFLIFENDPFVRSDICEALAEEFAGHLIAGYENVQAAWSETVSAEDCYVVILSLPSAALTSAKELVSAALPKAKLLVIGDDESVVAEHGGNYAYLQKPFSSLTLLASVRTLLGDRPEDRS